MWNDEMWSDIERDFKDRNHLQYIEVVDFNDMFDIADFKYHYSSRIDGIVLDKFVNNRYTNVVDLIIPHKIDGKPVKVIGGYCFACSLYIERVAIPSTVIEIQDAAFMNCRNLYSVIFGAGEMSIGASAFSSTAIETIALPRGTSYLQINTFYDCPKIKEIFLPDSIVILGDAFAYCTSLRQLFVPGSIKQIQGLSSYIGFYDLISPVAYGIQQSFPWYQNARYINAEDYWMTLDRTEETDDAADSPDDDEFDASTWSTESILMEHGYTVSRRAGLSDETRQKILYDVLSNRIATKYDVISHIELQINLRKANPMYSVAIEKWNKDLAYVRSIFN